MSKILSTHYGINTGNEMSDTQKITVELTCGEITVLDKAIKDFYDQLKDTVQNAKSPMVAGKAIVDKKLINDLVIKFQEQGVNL